MKQSTREQHLQNIERIRQENPADVAEYMVAAGITQKDLIAPEKSGFGTQAAQGALLGGFDEGLAAVRSFSLDDPFPGIVPATREGMDRYNTEVARIRQGMADYEQENPGKAMAAQMAGALATSIPLALIPGGQAVGASRLATTGRLMGQGAVEGAAAGYLSDNEDRARGATQGGMMGALFPLGISALGAGKDVAAPALLNKAQENIAGNVLRKMATNPDAAVASMRANNTTLVPGSVPTTAQVARDPGLAAFDTTVRSVDPTNRMAERIIEQNQARTDMLTRMARDTDAVEAAKAQRDAVALPMLQEALDNATGLIDANALGIAMEAVKNKPGIRSQKTVRDSVNFYIKELEQIVGRNEAGDLNPISAEDLYGLRKEINLAMSGKLQGEEQNKRLAKAQLQEIVGIIDAQIESVAPGFREYLTTYKQRSQPVNQMETLQDIQLKSEVAGRNLVSGDGVLSAAKLTSQLKGPAGREKLARLSEAQRRRVNRILTDLQRAGAATSPGVKVPGSDTMKNLSVAALVGRTFGGGADSKLGDALANRLAFLNFGEDKIQELIVQAMLDPELAARLMTTASEETVDGFINAAQRKLPSLFAGTTGAVIGLQQQ
tara:strand:- start:271 stop:2094 length:1824 start_codon:yes stop_codon:yes gene_type:complete